MKVFALNASPRKDGNTALLINKIFSTLNKYNIETEMYQLAGETLRGCTACRTCFEKKNMQCVFKNDCLNEIVQKTAEADGIIFGSPTYFADVTAEMKAIIDRLGYVNKANGNFLKRKVGAGVSAVRRGGANRVFDTFNHFFLINEMIVPGSIYWNFAFGRNVGEVENDEEGMRTMEALGENIAWIMKKIGGGK
ncbi:flavodoxin family protein [Flexistipes sinusarabici]|uniref:flavodoxin family protein n=1 Tax=Flexistipes sinusarabici TaxID=2352 RepID=UPI00235212DD|nr:flavodoxin family protein [Flexistipes sinusarabici]